MDESREASFTKKAVAFQAYSSLTKDLQDLDDGWSFALILRDKWQHRQGTALPWGTDVLPFQSCGMRVSPAPCSSQGPSHSSKWDWDLCRSRNLSSSSSHTCLPFASAKGFLLEEGTDLPYLWLLPHSPFSPFFILRDDHSAGRWVRIFPWVPPSPCWCDQWLWGDQSPELWAGDLPLGWCCWAADELPYSFRFHFSPTGLWFTGFLSVWESDSVKTPQGTHFTAKWRVFP